MLIKLGNSSSVGRGVTSGATITDVLWWFRQCIFMLILLSFYGVAIVLVLAMLVARVCTIQLELRRVDEIKRRFHPGFLLQREIDWNCVQ